MPRRLTLSLDAVIVAVTADQPRILTTTPAAATACRPCPPACSTPTATRRSNSACGAGSRAQTGLAVGYVEQLYTFGDRDRQRTRGRHAPPVGRLPRARQGSAARARRRLDRRLRPAALGGSARRHAGNRQRRAAARRSRAGPAATPRAGTACTRISATGAPGTRSACSSATSSCTRPASCPNIERDRGRRPGTGRGTGTELAFDHRRIVATALGRLRGKLKYRPVVFELLPETFTLLQLQRTVEALTGMRLHKQNFRRLVENGRFLEPTRGARKGPQEAVPQSFSASAKRSCAPASIDIKYSLRA